MDMNKLLWKLNDIESGVGRQTAYKPGGENADLVNILNKFNLIAEGSDPKQLPADFNPKNISPVLGSSDDKTDPMKGYFFGGESLDGNTPDSGIDGDDVGNTQINMASDEPTPEVPTESMDGVSTDTKNVLEGFGDNPVSQAITNRIIRSELDLLSQYGPEFVMNAIDEVADFVGDVDEIGTSDVSAWVDQVKKILQLKGNGDLEEGILGRAKDAAKKWLDDAPKRRAAMAQDDDATNVFSRDVTDPFKVQAPGNVMDFMGGGMDEGYKIMPNIDRERYTDLSGEGLEGPFQTNDGRIVYYDPKAGQYYDRDTDMYLDRDEVNMTESLEKRLFRELQETKINEDMSNAHKEGQSAQKAGKTRQNNPYKEGSLAAKYWARGWEQAKTKTPADKFTEAVANEDVVSAVKKTLGDYLKSLDDVKSDSDLKDKVEKAVDVLGPVVKSIMADNGKTIKVHGNEDDGFRVSIQDKPSKSTFKSVDEAVMAVEMFNARQRARAVPVEIDTPAEPVRVVRPAANRLAAKMSQMDQGSEDYVDEK